jgi:hypothetical protein
MADEHPPGDVWAIGAATSPTSAGGAASSRRMTPARGPGGSVASCRFTS